MLRLKFIKRMLIVSLSLILMTSFSISSNSTVNVPVYKYNSKESKKIALTFDDGPHPKNTPLIINLLNQFNVKATFFVIGLNVVHYPEVFKMIRENGHEIGNHTYSHKSLKNKNNEYISREILDTEKIIFEDGCEEWKLVRPPCGLYDKALLGFAMDNNYKIILWNIDTKDWEHKSKDEIVNNITLNAKGGDIILFHDYISGENNTIEALKVIVPYFLKSGYEFVTVSELLQDV